MSNLNVDRYKKRGDRMKLRREELGLSQHDVAEKVGTSQRMISSIESGETKNTKMIPRIAKALNVEIEWLSNGKGEKERIEIDVTDAEKIILKTHTHVTYEVIKTGNK